ncbi:hypothetical protein EC973_006401 [Apophysomyces ossiformis]|uniref:Uncharacterized protein n=1 Tax=Apophysomyces ossiformis TaxID=679940 RepID=A0A8H7C0S0_9FUNG|nr:hypothetical protein EC973_006401 [Apophysomyces ossiformis]
MTSPDSGSSSPPAPLVELEEISRPNSNDMACSTSNRVLAKKAWQKSSVEVKIHREESDHDDKSFSSARRLRADTMPSQSSSFPYSADRFDPAVTTIDEIATTQPLSRNRSGSMTLQPPLANPFGQGIFHNWAEETLQSPTTPTTDQLLKGDDGNTIASTLASLGLDEDRDRRPMLHTSQSHTSLRTMDHLSHWYRPSRYLPPHDDVPSSVGWARFGMMATLPTGDNPNLRGEEHLQLPSVANVRLQAQTGRPRAISMSVADDRHTPSSEGDALTNLTSQRSIWHSNIHHQTRPYLRNSNSSADLLEMIARQRKVAATAEFTQSKNEESWETPRFVSNNLSPSSYDVSNGSLGDMDGDTPSSGKNSPGSSSAQTPTRSLWLGNIDPGLTVNDLDCYFAPCGTIDSIRILPDRECAFVNFLILEDALRAKEYLNANGNRLGNAAVKVGFGKPEAGPQPSLDMGTNVQGPTRALWIGNIPTTTTPAALQSIFSAFGPIESARVLSNKNCGFVNFVVQDDAIRAKKALQNKEIMGPGTGTVRIGYAKVPVRSTPDPMDAVMDEKPKPVSWPSVLPSAPPVEPDHQTQMMMYMMTEMMNTKSNSIFAVVANERRLIMKEFGEDETDGPAFEELHIPLRYYSTIAAAPELGQSRKVDTARLRDIRKRLDSGQVPIKELESIAVECMDEIIELCSDYIGNTVIQRLFERCSELTKSRMLEIVAPHLASIGVHKNGTWAAQKIIETAHLSAQIDLICSHIKPYVPALLLDQFGNYVVQGCLGLGPERNQFIFDAIVDSCWEIAQGRFGSRAVRATLESPYVTKRQQKYVAATLIQHALLLATNANGALLLIWLLDTSGIPGRYRILAPRLTPHLARLCTHKLAWLTVLKLVNQRQEPDARALILDTLFFSSTDQVIDEVLQDQVHGVNLVQKILLSSYVDLRERQRIAERVKHLLHKLRLQHVQGYKHLVDEINLVMCDSNPGASLAALPGLVSSSFTISPELAATLHATYMAAAAAAAASAGGSNNGTSNTSNNNNSGTIAQAGEDSGTGESPKPDMSLQSQAMAAAAVMANMYAAATASSWSPPPTLDTLGTQQQQRQQQLPSLPSMPQQQQQQMSPTLSSSRRSSLHDTLADTTPSSSS